MFKQETMEEAEEQKTGKGMVEIESKREHGKNEAEHEKWP